MCDGYENSTGTAQYWTAAAVARKMAEMKFLYGYTDYERRLDELCDLTGEFTHSLERGHGLTLLSPFLFHSL